MFEYEKVNGYFNYYWKSAVTKFNGQEILEA